MLRSLYLLREGGICLHWTGGVPGSVWMMLEMGKILSELELARLEKYKIKIQLLKWSTEGNWDGLRHLIVKDGNRKLWQVWGKWVEGSQKAKDRMGRAYLTNDMPKKKGSIFWGQLGGQRKGKRSAYGWHNPKPGRQQGFRKRNRKSSCACHE